MLAVSNANKVRIIDILFGSIYCNYFILGMCKKTLYYIHSPNDSTPKILAIFFLSKWALLLFFSCFLRHIQGGARVCNTGQLISILVKEIMSMVYPNSRKYFIISSYQFLAFFFSWFFFFFSFSPVLNNTDLVRPVMSVHHTYQVAIPLA